MCTQFGPSGNRELRGVIPRAADALFSGIADSEELDEVTIKCSFCEIYMEGIRDLLQPKARGLKVRELPSGEVYVQNLSDQYVGSAADIMALLAAGEKNRSTAATEMNEVSSRSHSVLIVVVSMKLKDGSVRVGKLNLADLAGSERVERTNASGSTLEEAKKINQSLSALGNCINALTDTKRTHTPFRDSVLTFLLKVRPKAEHSDRERGRARGAGSAVAWAGRLRDGSRYVQEATLAAHRSSLFLTLSLGVCVLACACVQDSLGGNTKTTLLVCASPEENDCLETVGQQHGEGGMEGGMQCVARYAAGERVSSHRPSFPLALRPHSRPPRQLSTLNFAKRAKRIKNVTSINQKLSAAELAAIVASLRKELGLAGKTIVALQKTVRTLLAGGTIPKHMLDDLLRPVLLQAANAALPEGTTPRSDSAATAPATEPMSPSSPAPAPAPADVDAGADAGAAAPRTPGQHPLEAGGGGGLLDVEELLSPLLLSPTLPSVPASPADAPRPAAAAPSPREEDASASASPAPDADTDAEPLSPLRAQLELETSLLLANADSKLGRAAAEIDDLRGQLESSQRAARQREAEWDAERARMREEFEAEMQRASAAAATSTPVQPVPSSSAVAAPAAAAATPAAATADADAAPESESHPASPLSSPLVEALRAKNLRLEKQMAEMKETWTAYLDLILENQKALEAESQRRAHPGDYGDDGAAGGAGANAHSKSAKVVKPIVVKPPSRKSGGGFFSTLKNSFRKSMTPASPPAQPVGGDSAAGAGSGAGAGGAAGSAGEPASSGTSSATARVRSTGQSGTYERDGASASASASASTTTNTTGQSSASSSAFNSPSQGPDHRRTGSSNNPPSAPLSRTASATNRQSGTAFSPQQPAAASPSAAGFNQAIRIGYLSKKPVGFSLTRAWRNRLFVLRPSCLDYYEIKIQPNAAEGPAAAVAGGPEQNSSASTPDDRPTSPLASGAAASASASTSASTSASAPPSEPAAASNGLAAFSSAPANLLERLRGSIALDAQTSVVLVSYPEAPWGLEVTTRDKHTKLHAASDAERVGWMRDVVAVVDCLKRGVDPAVLVPSNGGAVLIDSPSPDDDGRAGATDANGMTLDPHLIDHANHLLQQALLTIPDASPSDRLSVCVAGSAPQADTAAATVGLAGEQSAQS